MFGFLAKLLLPIFSGITSNAIRIVVIAAIVGLGGFAWLVKHDATIQIKAMQSCPPQTVISGSNNVIDQRTKKMRCFPLAISRWGIGICHD